MPDEAAIERRFPRRLLLGGGAAAAALAAVEVIRPAPAAAAPASTPWRLGGNPDVTTDGTNFIGPTNVAPLIFKSGKANGTLAERMRIAANGRIGIGTVGPVSQLDVKGAGVIGIRGTSDIGYGVQGVSSSTCGVQGTSASSNGVEGRSGYIGVYGDADSYGGVFYGETSGSYGVYGSGVYCGTYGAGSSYGGRFSGPTAVYGSGSSYGVYTTASSAGGVGVYSTVSSGTAVYGTVSSGVGVQGNGGQYSVRGTGGGSGGVRGDSPYVGIWGEGATYGGYGKATATSGQNYGLFGEVASSAGFAVWASGNLHCTGTVSKAAGSFKIDHPLDPDNRWLSHSFVESPDMMNVYNGNVVLGKNGSATVELPEYFGALNRDFRYQLTCIGGHAPVYVSAKVAENRFSIAGGTAGLEVSWQVTGIRQDDYAKAHPIVTEAAKVGKEKGARQFVAEGTDAVRMTVSPVAADLPAAPKAPPVPAAVPAHPGR